MLARTPLLILSVLAAAGLAGCSDDTPDAPEESAAANDTLPPPGGPDVSAMCVEGAEDCDDTPTMETVDDPGYVGT